MSRTIDLFIASSLPVDQVAGEIGRLSKLAPIPAPDGLSWSFDHDDVHAVLKVHNYVDDGELRLERYPYALSARVADKAWMGNAAQTVFLRRVAEALRFDDPAGTKFITLLVHDLQNRDRSPLVSSGRPAEPAPAGTDAEEGRDAAPDAGGWSGDGDGADHDTGAPTDIAAGR